MISHKYKVNILKSNGNFFNQDIVYSNIIHIADITINKHFKLNTTKRVCFSENSKWEEGD